MNFLIDPKILNFVGVAILMLTLSMLVLRGFRSSLNSYAVHSLGVALITFAFGFKLGNEHVYFAAVATFIIKVFVIPSLMIRIVSTMRARIETKLLVSPPIIFTIAVGLVILSSHMVGILVGKLSTLATLSTSAVAVAMLGMLMIVVRKDAIIQVIGLLTMENGLFLIGLLFTGGMPFFVEVGIFIDVVLTSVLLWVYLRRMQNELKTTNTLLMSKLRG